MGGIVPSHCRMACAPSRSSDTMWWLTPFTPITCRQKVLSLTEEAGSASVNA